MFESNIWQILLISKMWYGFASSVLRGHIVSETYQKAKRHCHLVTKAVIYFVPEGLFAAYIYLNNIDAVYFLYAWPLWHTVCFILCEALLQR